MALYKRKTPLFIFSILITLLLSQCYSDYYYDSEIDIPEGGWNYMQAAVFEPSIKDTSQVFNLIFALSNTNEYRYNNIWFFVKTTSPNGASSKDTLEYFITETNGKWVGNKSGDMWKSKMYFKNAVRFPTQGKYKFEIWQGMREDTLKGISKIGMLIEKL